LLPDLGERAIVVGRRGSPRGVVGCVDGGRDAGRGDCREVPAECLSRYDPDLNMIDIPAGVEGCKPGEEFGVCCSPRCG